MSGRPKEISVRVGESVDINLVEYGAEGYVWDINHLLSSAVVKVSIDQNVHEVPVTIGGWNGVSIRLTGERVGRGMLLCRRPFGPKDCLNSIRINVLPREGGMQPSDLFIGKQFVFYHGRYEVLELHTRQRFLAARVNDDGTSWSGTPEYIPIYLLPETQEVEQIPLDGLEREIVPGSLWQHRRGGLYVILTDGARMEATGDSDFVVYRGLVKGDVWVRSVSEFLDSDDENSWRFHRIF